MGEARTRGRNPRRRPAQKLEPAIHFCRPRRLRPVPEQVPAVFRVLEKVRRPRVLHRRYRDSRNGTYISHEVWIKAALTCHCRSTSAVCPASPAPSISGKTTATSRWILAITTISFASKCLLPCVKCECTRFTLITPKGVMAAWLQRPTTPLRDRSHRSFPAYPLHIPSFTYACLR